MSQSSLEILEFVSRDLCNKSSKDKRQNLSGNEKKKKKKKKKKN